ncbi:endonuclease III-like protein 1 [Armigeres subalbatus]|uniref:endonuclease III-like protein 1 n=1 Tax=Armigeres subalbatus TaxID=124917 RepID=UPI002ED65117
MIKLNVKYFKDLVCKMESKSPYFSPKKTRNFVKQKHTGLKETLQKKSAADGIKGETPSFVKSCVPEIKIGAIPKAPEHAEPKRRQRKKQIKVQSSPDRSSEVYYPEQRTPVKVDPSETVVSSSANENPFVVIKTEKESSAETDSAVKQTKWEPDNWRQTLENIRQMRQMMQAPVDTMGCDQFKDDENVPPITRRFHTLVSLMLSSQTKDQVNFDCMQRLRKHGLTPADIVATDVAVLEKLIYPVSFYKNKAKFIKQASQILLDTYNGDIPDTIEGLLKLPGVGKKMAHLCMRSAWNVVTGIGVDTHVHRICNWLRWVPKETKTPEDTRVALEKWLPFELWEEVNQLLVGFGQTICPASYPHCNECLNAAICPAKGKHGIRKTPIKKQIKKEELEF